MKKDEQCQKMNGPFVIGGLGGSGTRVVAKLLMELGYYIGDDLNSAHDNLWFTLLFKRPDWFFKNLENNENTIYKNLTIFEKKMKGIINLNYEERLYIIEAVNDYLDGYEQGLIRANSMLHTNFENDLPYIGWGWKEPNSHIYIKFLHSYFKNLKYIHVIRHGLDIAYSTNQQQLRNWGRLFNIQVPSSPTLIPKASLQYWIESNKRALSLGQNLLKDRFYVINYNQLCLNPKKEIVSLIEFLGLDKKNLELDFLVSLINTSNFQGRYKKQDLSIFTETQMNAVREFGFTIAEL